MSDKIISIKPTEEYFSLNWQLAVRCNYDCMYCSPEWHDSTSQHYDLDTMKQAWKNIYDKTQYLGLKYKIAFTGGELTTNKHFLPFVTWLRQEYNDRLFKVMTTTNGSATYKYYLRMFDSIDNIAFSIHTEHINEKKFFDMIIKLHQTISPDKFLQVAIMEEFWNKDRISLYTDLLDRHGISYTVNRIDYSYQTRSFPIMKGKLNLGI